MAGRWVLERAGITNVYQYGEEVLHFAGGRLLLRGVNGSGKSTAMNMLLPFLLEADTRRIDAAGEQAGVLRSWMLSGREEQQPQGYLWVELVNGTDHLAFGCGIRANRSTDRVTTWWFVTAKRPGIDVALVEGRQPLSADALRSELEPGAVYSQDQRSSYRAELRSRLYGGADLDQHVRLLHVVRSPRVGDRIDVDLPRYLEDALPQLSETALDDAAQPLEDLEEHRRNVEDLERTTTALHSLRGTYRRYAVAELHRRAAEAVHLVGERTRLERIEATARTTRQAAAEAFRRATSARQEWEHTVGRLDGEIRNLEASDAYKAGAELNDLRDHVRSLANQVGAATEEVERREAATARALQSLRRAGAETAQEAATVHDRLAALDDHAGRSGLGSRPPDSPAIDVRPLVDAPAGPVAPIAALDVDELRARLGEVQAAVHRRSGDVEEVRRALAATVRAEAALDRAERRLADALEAQTAAQGAFGAARDALHEASEQWQEGLRRWCERLAGHRAANGLPVLAADVDPEHALDSAGSHAVLTVGWLDVVNQTIDAHVRARAGLEAERAGQAAEVVRLTELVAVLEAQVLPEPPTSAWQRRDGGPRLAELVDFADALPAAQRAGLEAAMEAAGLLGAELAPDGTLVLADGQLAVAPGTTATDPLSDLLTVTVPDDLAGAVDAKSVRQVLEAISVDDGPATTGAATVVTTTGRFRTGLLSGRHAKAEAEHIGVTARRAALARRRAAAREELEAATAASRAVDEALGAAGARIDAATALRDELPSADGLRSALARSALTEEALDEARSRHAARQAERADADRAHAESVEAAHRTAASLGLPADAAGLDSVQRALTDASSGCHLATEAVSSLARSVSRWIAQGQVWSRSADDQARSAAHLAHLRGQLDLRASRLATLEDSIGAGYDEVVAAIETSRTDLGQAEERRRASRAEELESSRQEERAHADHRAASADREAADARCVAALPRLRAAVGVPGLLAAACSTEQPGASPPEPAALPTVAETPGGLEQLAAAVRALVGEPDGTETTAEGVRQSLRQRRDALGAGWDAEDHQPDDRLPLHIEVTGPLGRMPLADAAARVDAQLAEMSGLLSTKQDQALRNLLQGLVAREVAEKLHAAGELVKRMNARLETITTSQGIGVSLRWRRRDDLDPATVATVDLLATPADLRTVEEDHTLIAALSARIAQARRDDPEQPYRELIASVLDYRGWHRMALVLRRPGRNDELLTRRTALSEGEKKMVSYLPLFAAVAASCDALAERAPDAPRFVLLDDAFAKVSEDNHAKLFGLLVELDLDFIATSERLWGTHDTVPQLAITEVIRDADLGAIVLEHSRWDGHRRATS